jgi:ADP-ribosylglycohydrolase/catechol 2,3-dioxygenase-like lactoylglutathione lyase family enzyme
MSPLPKSSDAGPIRLLARAEGAMLAAASGDALGWPIEPRGNRVGGTRGLEPQLAFIDWTRREGARYAPRERLIPAGTYSDDTQLMLAAARSAGLGDEWWQHFTGLELPMWTLYELGGGGAVKRAAQSWARGVAPWAQAKPADRRKYFEAGANGVVMRILPHAIYGAEEDTFSPIADRIFANGIATHGHPRALIGALAAGYGMWKSLRWEGKVGYGDLIDQCLDEREAWSELRDLADYAPDWSERAHHTLDAEYQRIWTRTVEEMLDLLETCRGAMSRGSLARDSKVLEELGAFGPEGGAGTRTTAVAMYLASRYVARPSSGLLAAAFTRKIDADTIACVTGALLGALSGNDWLDGLAAGLQDAGYIRELAEALAVHRPVEVAREEWRPEFKRRLLDRLKGIEVGDRLPLPVFGEGHVSKIECPETRSANDIRIWWLETALGQHLAITKVTKQMPAKRAERRAPGVGNKEDAAEQQLAIGQAMDNQDSKQHQAEIWTALLVKDLDRSIRLYHDLLGLPICRRGEDFVIFHPNLLVQLDDRGGRQNRFDPIRTTPTSSFETSPIIGVLVPAKALHAAHRRVGQAGLFLSRMVNDPEGDRFRFQDEDGHIVEVRAAPHL